jgi:hypothetical protein
MPRRALIIILLPALALALAGCAPKAAQHPAPPPPKLTATANDPAGDPVDADGNTRKGRRDVDVTYVEVDRGPALGSDVVRFTVITRIAPQTPMHYELFAQAPEVDGYDVATVTRNGTTATGYVTFEGSVARQRLPGVTANGNQLSFDVPVDPILGATPFDWRLTASTAKGPVITDWVPSRSGTVRFPGKG